MPYYKFKESDLFYNQIETHPKKQFFVYNSSIFLDNRSRIVGAFTGSVPDVPTGYTSLYELNVDRVSGSSARVFGDSSEFALYNYGMIYPFITKAGNLTAFKTISSADFFSQLPGTVMSSSYPMSASITRNLYTASATRDQTANRISALRTAFDYYQPLSPVYAYSSSFGDKALQAISLISIPSIFYGSSIEKGSVDLKFYITGTLIGRLQDENFNGELIQTGPADSNGSGSVAGMVLYNEGFVALTGSWALDDIAGLDYTDDGSATRSSWLYYAVGANDGIGPDALSSRTRQSASYDMSFRGTNYVPVITMLAHAPKAELNYSSNPTYIKKDQTARFSFNSSSIGYGESVKQEIKNIVTSSYPDPTGSYEPQTYISKIGIFDKDKNLIGIAKMATPVKKTEERDLTFKLKLDF